MLAYTIRRLLVGLLTLLVVSFLIYGLIRAMPGDPAAIRFEDSGPMLTTRQLEQMRRDFELDEPWLLAYLRWAGKAVRGDLGTSLHFREPVSRVLAETLGPTLLLSFTSLGLAYLLSVPLGIYSAHRSGRPDERALSSLLYVLYSFPSYVMAILLLLVLAVKLGWLPVSGMRSAEYDELSFWGRIWDQIRHMILPVTCYTYGSLAYLTRFVRANMLEALSQDYIRTARAKGLGEGAILWRHAFRNALIPFLTLLGLTLPALVGGAVILEQIFAWPGMGRLFFQALDARDYTLIMGITVMFSLLVVLGTLLADLLYARVDPRISYS